MVAINNAIIMLPYHIAAPLIDSINKQITKSKEVDVVTNQDGSRSVVNQEL